MPPPAPGYVDYWASVEVRLHRAIPVEDSDQDEEGLGPVVGYIRNFGVRVVESELRSFIEQTITDGVIRWERTELYPVDPDNLDSIIRKRIVAVDPGGVWYVSGRAFYSDDSEGESETFH